MNEATHVIDKSDTVEFAGRSVHQMRVSMSDSCPDPPGYEVCWLPFR